MQYSYLRIWSKVSKVFKFIKHFWYGKPFAEHAFVRKIVIFLLHILSWRQDLAFAQRPDFLNRREKFPIAKTRHL